MTKRITPGDRLVRQLKQSTADVLNGGNLETVQWNPDEIARFELVRKTADDLAALEAAWAVDRDAGRFIVPGSRNQDVLNPLVAEIRAQRAQLDRLLNGFKLEASPGAQPHGSSRTEQARKAAAARWNGNPVAARWGTTSRPD